MRRLAAKLLSALCLLLAYGAAFVCAGALVLPKMPAHWILWPAAAVSAAVLAGLLPGKARIWGGLAGAALYALNCVLWIPRGLGMLYVVPCAAVYWQVLRASPKPPFAEWGMPAMLTGVGVYGAGMILMRLLESQDTLPALRVLLLGYIPVLLFFANREALDIGAAARVGMAPPRRVRAANRWLVSALAGAVFILANLGTIRDAFYQAASWLARGIGAAIGWLLALFAMEQAEAPHEMSPSQDQFFFGEAGEPSAFWRMLEKALYVLAALIGLALLVLLLYWLARRVRRLARRLIARLRAMGQQLGDGIQERTESIPGWEELRYAARRSVARVRGRFARQPSWQSLDNTGRVRWSYRRWLQGHPDTPASATAREALRGMDQGGRLAGLYEQARYGGEGMRITDEEAAYVRDTLRREG